MDEQEFLKAKKEAEERIRRMHERASIHGNAHAIPPVPGFVQFNNHPASVRGGANDSVSPMHSPPAEGEEKEKKQFEKRVAISGTENRFSGGLDFSALMKDSDTTLILGLLLLLYSENADRLLLLALLYILL